MASASPAAPPMSVLGAWRALRWPRAADLLFAAKGVLAITLSLLVGFSQDLDNPYWSALTIAVLMAQPQPGAIRTKSLFRLVGTVLGGGSAIVLAKLLASHVGVLVIATVTIVILTFYLKLLDATPASYTWFSAALTLAVIGVLHATQPQSIFSYAVARMAEIGLGIVMIGIVDSIVAPRTATPGFLDEMRDWRDRAGAYAADALASDAASGIDEDRRRRDMRALAAAVSTLDAQSVQLPYDTAPVPPRGRDLRFLRLTIVHLLATLSTARLWIVAARASATDAAFEDVVSRVRDWVSERTDVGGSALRDHAHRGEALRDRLSRMQEELSQAGDPEGVLRMAMLARLDELVEYWCRLDHALDAVASGRSMPHALVALSRRARPIRSVDYGVAALGMLPVVVALGFISAVWYLTAWTAGLNALLFAFIVASSVVGMPGALKSASAMCVWVGIAYAITFLNQFVILPRVTAFPILAAVLAVETFPLLVLMAMTPAAMMTTAMAYGALAIQGAYSGNFESSIQGLIGSLSGVLIAIAAMFLCQFDEPRLRARRLARAIDRDVIDAARARRIPDGERLLSLTVGRIGAYYAIVETLPVDDALRGRRLVAELRVAANLLTLRKAERALAAARPAIDRLRDAIAVRYARAAGHRPPVSAETIDAAYAAVRNETPSEPRTRALVGLAGLRLALDPQASA